MVIKSIRSRVTSQIPKCFGNQIQLKYKADNSTSKHCSSSPYEVEGTVLLRVGTALDL